MLSWKFTEKTHDSWGIWPQILQPIFKHAQLHLMKYHFRNCHFYPCHAIRNFEIFLNDISISSSGSLSVEEQLVSRQSYAGLLWSKQFYYYVTEDWLKGDPNMPTPPHSRTTGRNSEWKYLHNKEIISMPDKWEYPWVSMTFWWYYLIGLPVEIEKPQVNHDEIRH